ncbi:MAG: hypothetical protein KDD64_06180 [Bdellovibrionales bacterium]|nr:hypothetical protein [Bdellovibrionales bacterium]
MSPREFLCQILPYAVVASRYAERIQNRIARQPVKEGDNPFKQALSDADLSVQAFFEVVLLGAFPHLGFYGEEEERSLNAKYFSRDQSETVLLDPIDGTLLYLHGKPEFAVVVSLVNETRFLGTLWVYPREEHFWFATEETGVRLGAIADAASPDKWELQKLEPRGEEILAYCSAQAIGALRKSFSVFDCRTDFDPSKPFSKGLELFRDRWAGVYAEEVLAIDIGALAFMTDLLGGVVSDGGGQPLAPLSSLERYSYSSIALSCRAEVHERMISALEGRPPGSR